MKQKEIYIAKLDPVEGHEQGGIRPVVVISGDAMNFNLGMCITCPLSSQIKEYPGAVLIKKSKHNNLVSDSEVLSFQVRTISLKRLLQKVGEITDEELSEIHKGLYHTLRFD